MVDWVDVLIASGLILCLTNIILQVCYAYSFMSRIEKELARHSYQGIPPELSKSLSDFRTVTWAVKFACISFMGGAWYVAS